MAWEREGEMGKIVVWDPHGAIPEGQAVPEGENTRRAELMRGLVTLPYEEGLKELGAVGGFAKKSFGAGVIFAKSEPTRACSLLVAATNDSTRLHWVARLAHLDMAGEPPHGNLRLCTMPNTVSTSACGAVPLDQPIELMNLGQPDRWGGWTVRGVAAISCPVAAGYVSVGLLGIAQRLCVTWFAASVTRGE